MMSLLVACVGCQFKLMPEDSAATQPLVSIARYDQLEYRYLTTGDFSALQEMNTEYPIETRTLIEDVVKVGDATDPSINSKLLKFYQDTILQSIIADVEAEYADIDDLNTGSATLSRDSRRHSLISVCPASIRRSLLWTKAWLWATA